MSFRKQAALEKRIAELEWLLAAALKRIEELEAQLGQNSSNSSKPPSTDISGTARRGKEPTGRLRGGQAGHKRSLRQLVPVEEVDHVEELVPSKCRRCGRRLTGRDPDPRRHQVTEVPVVRPTVTEYRLHALRCGCGESTRARLPLGVPQGSFGPVLASVVALCTVQFRQSKRLAQTLLSTLLNVDLSLGAISKIERQTSQVLAEPVEEARTFAREQARANMDETGWTEDKEGGRKKRAWLWVLTTATVTVFQIAKSRGEDVAKQMLGEGFGGILGTDRWGGYNWVKTHRRQLCWSHLLRDFQGFVDRGGRGAEIGKRLLEEAKRMFHWWHRIRDGTLSRATFQRRMKPVERKIIALLEEAVVCAESKTKGMAKKMLGIKQALFTFVHHSDVEPTNNISERRIRQGVILRKLTFGTDSAAGSRFVERMLTVSTTLQQQDRPVLDFLVAAHEAHLHRTKPPSLLQLARA